MIISFFTDGGFEDFSGLGGGAGCCGHADTKGRMRQEIRIIKRYVLLGNIGACRQYEFNPSLQKAIKKEFTIFNTIAHVKCSCELYF
ncbi:MAG TPA: hypothetical protein VF905_04780, partial [Nitrospirota bacterium]